MSNSIADLRARVQGLTASTPAPTPTPSPTITEKPQEPKTYIIERGEQKFVGSGATVEEAKADALKQAEAATATSPAVPSSGETVRVNPPEGDIAPTANPAPATSTPPVQANADTSEKEANADKAPKTQRKRATAKSGDKDPIGADAAMHTGLDEKQELEKTIAATTQARTGFTLYVDCIPIGRPAKAAAGLISKAQERMAIDGPRDAAGQAVPDYRLVDFGKGTPAFVAFVLDQVDGSFDLALDTRSPEGAVLLEPLMARAAFVVRGLR